MNEGWGITTVKMMNKYRAWVVPGGVLALLAVAACTPSGDDGGDGVELVWALGGSEAQEGGTHQQIVQVWNEQNPDTPVRIDILPDSADEQRREHALVLQAQGSEFDILGTDVIWTGEYAENGWLESLEDVRSEIEPVSIPGAFESATWGGELWAAPYNSNAGFLYYRTDLVDTPPTTWDEMCEMGASIGEQEDISGFVGQGAQYEGFVVNWLEYYWSAGGELFNEDQTQVLFDVDTAVQATEFMADAMGSCYASGINTMQEAESLNEFQAGNAVFMRNWPYAVQVINDDATSPASGNFEIAPLPTFSGQGTISALGGFNNAVSAFSEHKDAAKEFVVWAATDPEPQAMLAEVGSVPPTLQSVYEQLADDPVMALLGEVLPDARPRPPAPFWNDVSVEMQQALFPAVNGDGDIREACESVRAFLEEQIS